MPSRRFYTAKSGRFPKLLGLSSQKSRRLGIDVIYPRDGAGKTGDASSGLVAAPWLVGSRTYKGLFSGDVMGEMALAEFSLRHGV